MTAAEQGERGSAKMVHHKKRLAVAAVALIALGAPARAREIVRYDGEGQPGTIVVKTAERRVSFLVWGGRGHPHPLPPRQAGEGREGAAAGGGQEHKTP